MTIMMDTNNNNNHFLLPIYKVYPDLGMINPCSILETQQDEENYYKSLLYGCKECDRIEPSLQFMLYHRCTKNGKSKYKQHQQEALNRKKEKLENTNKSNL
jgi:hypothetical protein